MKKKPINQGKNIATGVVSSIITIGVTDILKSPQDYGSSYENEPNAFSGLRNKESIPKEIPDEPASKAMSKEEVVGNVIKSKEKALHIHNSKK